ncbi:MAG: cation transporter, partial [Patescibacteria group bacterium]
MNEHLVADKLRRYRLALYTNITVWVLQSCIYFFWADSKSLLGDALHSLSDTIVIAGIVYLTAHELAHPERKHDAIDRRFTRGAVLLLLVSAGYVLWEGVGRILYPEVYPAGIVIGITLVAIVGNFLAHRTMSGVAQSMHDHKHHASVMHVLADLVISLVVLASALGTI